MKFGVTRRFASALCVGLVAAPALADNTLTTVFRFYQSTTEADVIFGDAGYLFGTTNSYSVGHGGTIFKVRPDGSDLQTIYQLGSADGISPNSGLLKASDGNYYGTTQFSSRGVQYSATGDGTIYQFKTNSGAPTYTTLHLFNLAATEGSFVLLVNGVRSTTYVRAGNLIEDNGLLYGTTPYGGASGTGTVYSFPLSTPGTTPAFVSLNALDANLKNDGGSQPAGSLIKASNGYFYGTAAGGGLYAAGAVFSFDGVGTITSVLDFAALDSTGHTDCGTAPQGGVVEVNGFLYGTTSAGGANGVGTVFKVPLDGQKHTCGDGAVVFASFDGSSGTSSGSSPLAELIKDQSDTHTLYGTASSGGAAGGYGTIFKVVVSDGPQDVPVISQVMAFDSTHGAAPHTRLLQSADGTFYGTTSAGGGDYCTSGTVYRYGPSGPTDAGSPCPSTGGGSMTPAILLLLSTLGLARRYGSRPVTVERMI